MRKVKLTEDQAAVLLDHVVRGAAHPLVGFEDADRTQRELLGALRNRAVDVEELESALWSCNLLREIGEWRGPGEFLDFLAGLIPKGMTYDEFFCVFEEMEE